MRRNPPVAYGIALGAVVLATALRWVVEGEVVQGLPFITYYAAIVFVALLGGLWPAALATAASALLAWYLFLPPQFGWDLTQPQLFSLLLFGLIAALNIAVVTVMNAAMERVLAHQENVRALLESAPNGIVVVNEQGMIQAVNQRTERLFGYGRAELVGKSVEVLVPHARAANHRQLRGAFQKKPETRAMGAGRDLAGRRKDGTEFPLEIGLNPVGLTGRTAVLATVIDISERRRAQERQEFLTRELRHRSQNLFTVIEAIASRSLEEGHSLDEAKKVFLGRLHALARAHAMLAEAAWAGAMLSKIIEQEVAGFSNYVDLAGCDIVVNTPAAQQFALIVHELGTNAVKYGALSSPNGRIAIEGTIGEKNGAKTLFFTWRETGGPPVSEPRRRGFGSVLLLRAAKQFSDHVALNFHPAGVVYELTVPVGVIEMQPMDEKVGGEASAVPRAEQVVSPVV
jgi:PAS domain S-box-containing protein